MADNQIKVTLSAVDKLSGPLASAQNAIGRFASSALSLSGALGGLGAAFSAASIAAWVKSAIDGADAMGKMAQSAGVGVEALSGLAYAAKLSGLSTEQLGSGLTKLNKSIGDAAGGSGQAADAFKALGVSVTNSSGGLKSADVLLGDLADRFAGMQDGAAKTALAMQIFGRSGAAMIPMLNSGAAGIKGMADEAARLGLVISEDTARAAEEFNDNLDRLKAAGDGLAISLANETLPALTRISEAMAKAATEGGLLQAALTGLGGVSLFLFTDEFDSTAEKMRSLRADIAEWERLLKNKSGQGLLHDWVFGSREDLVEKIRKANVELRYLKESAETAKLQAAARAQAEDEASARATAAAEARMRASEREAAAARARKAHADLIARYMDRELDAAIKMQDAMVKAYDDGVIRKRVAAEKMLADQVDRVNAMLDARALAESDSIESAEALVRGIEQETELLGLSNEAREQTIALRALEREGIDLTSEALEEYRKRLVAAVSANQAAKAAKAAADESAAAWQRASADIERSLTDALLRGFEGGKDIAENFRDTLKNLFNTLILRPIIQPIAQYGSNMVMGMMGVGASGSAMAGGMGGAGNIFSLGSSLTGAMAPGAISTGTGVVVGGIAESLGASSAFAGSLGAGVATALPWIGAIAAMGSMFGLFGGKPSNKAAWGEVDLASGEISGLGNMTGKKQASQETMDARTAILQSVGGFSGMIGRMGGTLPWSSVGVDIGERDGVQFKFDGGARVSYGKNPDEAIRKLFGEMVAGTEGLAEHVKALLEGFDGLGSEMTAFAYALATIGDYQQADPLSDMLDALAESSRTLHDQLEASRVSTEGLADAFDGSLGSATALAEAVKGQYNLELQLVNQIQQALAGTASMFGGSIEQIRLDVLDAAGKYDYYRATADALYADLQAATDPAQIAALAEQLNAASMSAWGLLDAGQRQAASDDFIAYLEDVEQLTTTQLEASQAQITASHDALAEKIEQVMMEVAAAMQAAANTPLTVAVDVNVDTPASVEVAIA